jgi:hypothetical protein
MGKLERARLILVKANLGTLGTITNHKPVTEQTSPACLIGSQSVHNKSVLNEGGHEMSKQPLFKTVAIMNLSQNTALAPGKPTNHKRDWTGQRTISPPIRPDPHPRAPEVAFAKIAM